MQISIMSSKQNAGLPVNMAVSVYLICELSEADAVMVRQSSN